jgi:hypothetical protein
MLLYFRAGTGAGSARLSHSVTVLRYSLQRDATLLKVGGATQSHRECVFHESSISSSNELKDHSLGACSFKLRESKWVWAGDDCR